MDGTLLDSEHLHWGSAMTLLQKYARKSAPEPLLRDWIGWNETMFWDAMRDEFDLVQDNDTLVQSRTQLFFELFAQQGPRWMPGALHLLQELKSAGIPCAVVTAAPREQLDGVAERAGFREWFQTWLSGETDSPRSKPHPDPYLEGARRLGLNATECLALEDSPNGARAAVDAGCLTLAVPSLDMEADAFPGVAAVLESLEQVLPWLNARGAQIQRATRPR